MNSYIILKTAQKLDDDQEKLFYKIVKKLTPPNAVNSKLLKRSSNDYYNYKILLNDSLSYEDSKFIVNAWDYYFNYDFEIEISSKDEISDNTIIDMDDDSFNHIRKVASKYLHNRWIDKKIQEGWRYGLLYNKEEKTHPALKEWDNLPSEHKKLIELDKEKAYRFFIENKNLFT